MSKQLVSGGQRIRKAYWALVGIACAMILTVQPVMAETIWERFSSIMQDVYGQLVAISTIVAVTVAAIALIVRMVSRNQRAVDEATSWLKRIVVTWIVPVSYTHLDSPATRSRMGHVSLSASFYMAETWYGVLTSVQSSKSRHNAV